MGRGEGVMTNCLRVFDKRVGIFVKRVGEFGWFELGGD